MKYKELQIIKHSLQHYLNRPHATEKEIAEEKRLLDKITNQVDEMKERYGIKSPSKNRMKVNPTFNGSNEVVINLNQNELCPRCFGTGKQFAMQMAMTYDGGSIRDKDTSVKCEACKGTGFVK